MARAPAKRSVVRLPRAQREGDILAAAQAVFAARGYEDAAMSEIAARAGVVEGTVYKYFESKRDLLFRVMSRWYESMVTDFSSELAGIAGTRSRLRYLVWRHVRTIREYPALCRLFFREVRIERNYYRSLVHEMNRRYTSFVTAVIREGIAKGELKRDAPVALVRDLVFGGVEHHTWNYVYGRGALDVDAVADGITDMVWNGIAVPDHAAASVERLHAVAERLERAARSRRA